MEAAAAAEAEETTTENVCSSVVLGVSSLWEVPDGWLVE